MISSHQLSSIFRVLYRAVVLHVDRSAVAVVHETEGICAIRQGNHIIVFVHRVRDGATVKGLAGADAVVVVGVGLLSCVSPQRLGASLVHYLPVI